MYYRLKVDYALRGYRGATCVLVNRQNGMHKLLAPPVFRVLMLADGVSPLKLSDLTKDEQNHLKSMIKNGIVTASDSPDEIEEAQRYRLFDNRFVKAIMWSLTGRCNFRCRHCYLDSPDSVWHELTTAEAMNVIDQMAECGVLSVHLTGGEPLVRPDFWKIVDRLCEKNIHIGTIYSNAWLIDDALLDQLESRGLKPEFSISFDGLGWHDWMRGVPGAEKHTLEVMEKCVKRGFIVNAAISLHRGSAGTLRDTFLKLREIGVPKAKVGGVQPTDLWLKNNEGNLISDEEYLKIVLDYIPHYYEDGRPLFIHFGNVAILHPEPEKYKVTALRYPDSPESEDMYLCSNARFSGYIAPDGRLLPCLPMTACAEQEIFPMIGEIGLKQALTDSVYMHFIDRRVRDLMKVNDQCSVCPHKYVCGGGCRANALFSSCDLMGCDKLQCFLFENDYPARIRETIEKAIKAHCL